MIHPVARGRRRCTNVFIGLEDTKQIDPASAEIVRKCGEHAVGIFVHEATLLDIARDKDKTRRGISLSKVRKFQGSAVWWDWKLVGGRSAFNH